MMLGPLIMLFLLVLVVQVVHVALALQDPPVWSSTYSVSGHLYIPFAEIREKFDAYYDEPSGNSRIDYYVSRDLSFL